MIKFLDNWGISQRNCWIDSCKAKIKELEQQMESCLFSDKWKEYYNLMDRMEQEQETLSKLEEEVYATSPKTMQS